LGVPETGLRKATDLSSLVEDTVSDGLGSQLAFVKTRMNVEAFASRLNKAVLSALSKELKRLELEDSRIRGVLSDYQREFLNSASLGNLCG
jgi:replicative superfamily II helicase